MWNFKAIGPVLACLTVLAFWVFTAPASAAPHSYSLVKEGSEIAFTFDMDGTAVKGVVPVSSAKVTLDLEKYAGSKVDVTLAMAKAKTGVIFATQALRSPEVLAVKQYPTARFVSTSVRKSGEGATIKGKLTLRGVTRPITLKAQIYRKTGSDADDHSNLTILLTGVMDRRDFGAVGFPKLVKPRVELRILVLVKRQ